MDIKLSVLCESQAEVTAVLNKFYEDEHVNWYKETIHPAEYELSRGFFKNADSDIILNIQNSFPDNNFYIVWGKNSDDVLKFISDHKGKTISAQKYLSQSSFNFGYDVYDDDSNYVRTLYSENDLSNLVAEAQSTGKMFYVYTSKEERIDGEYDMSNTTILF